jgi:ribulose-5-phosphate 4-epimerase/fuculose-1-phosphate aldolase
VPTYREWIGTLDGMVNAAIKAQVNGYLLSQNYTEGSLVKQGQLLFQIDPRAALPPMTPYYLMKCGHTALVPYYRPGDPAVADAIKGLAGKYSSVLLANHGPVVSGESLEAAVFAIEELEETAKLYLLLRGLNPRYLTPAQIADLSKTFGLVLPEHGHE